LKKPVDVGTGGISFGVVHGAIPPSAKRFGIVMTGVVWTVRDRQGKLSSRRQELRVS
jgi:hypothetical protein